jgi:riboflavin kinase/FMN adenylyltransferase
MVFAAGLSLISANPTARAAAHAPCGAPPMTQQPPFQISGQTVRGKRLGTELGFPTANLRYPHMPSLPPNGVYVALAEIDGARYVAILNQGHHPTAPEGQPTIETHLLGFAGGDLYGRQLTLTYLAWLRPEKRFPTLEALKAQLRADAAAARDWAAQNGLAAEGTPAPAPRAAEGATPR